MPRSSLTSRLVIGLAAGVATGVFLGDEARWFAPLADGFVKLLQMAVLPYLTVSITGSIGALNPRDLRRLGIRTALVLLGVWAVVLPFAFLVALVFPQVNSGSFFSTTMLEPREPFSLVDLFIPANPFSALANGIVPAVVLFSILTGVALIGVPRKQVLLDVLAAASSTLARVMGFMVRLTPYGLFAIGATTAGTIRLEQAARLEIYLVAYGMLALLLALWVLPGLVSALTPIPLRDLFRSTREALLTAAVAGDVFIVLPVLIAACRDLISRHVPAPAQAAEMPDIIAPVSFNFPHSGKLLTISFVLFAGWFADAGIVPAEYPRLALTGLLTLFGSTTAAVPFLLDLFRIPADTFQLFLASGILNSRFGSLVSAVHTVAVALLATCAATGALHVRRGALLRYVAVTLALVLAVVGATRTVAVRVVAGSPAAGAALDGLRLESRAAETRLDQPDLPVDAPPPGRRLETISRSGVLRVGYLSDSLPYAFINGHGELVGFDVAVMHRLATELGVAITFVPLPRHQMEGPDGARELLRRGGCDLLIGGIAVTTRRAELVHLSSPYLDETAAFVVRDGMRRQFETWDAIAAAGAITVAVPNVPYYVDMLQARVPHARLHRTDRIEEMFTSAFADATAFAIPAERGSAWTLRYPQYSVVVPSPGLVKVPLAYAMPPGEPALATFLDTWIELKRHDGTLDALYRTWILGRDDAPAPPRWSIMRNVLHWLP